MKNIISKSIFLLSILAGSSSCVKFLDQSPDAVAFSSNQIFTDYTKSQAFIDQLLVPYTYFDDNDIVNSNGSSYNSYGFCGKQAYGLRERITDNCIANQQYSWIILNSYRKGNFVDGSGSYWSEGSKERFSTMWKAIRVANLSIANIKMISGGVTDDQKASILGLAYFCRAHFYFMLLQGWGGMPMITKPLDPAQNMDLPRDSYTLTAQKIAATFDSAATYLPMVVSNTDYGRPTKMAALAYKAKALIWAASPFSNPTGDQGLWQDAAVACGQAINVAETSGYYHLVDMTNWKNMFVDVNDEALQEILFGRYYQNMSIGWTPYYCGIKSTEFGSNTMGAESVTENLAQCYTWNNGEPVNPSTNEYKTTPYFGDGVTHTGRDPRFYQSILFNGATTPQVAAAGRTVQIWNRSYNSVGAKELVVDGTFNATNGYTFTGYYNWKLFTQGFVTHNGKINIMWNYIRLADMYLYYAEAANRAWGPNTPPTGISGFTLTAAQSLNKIRTRAGMPIFDDASPMAWLKVGSVTQFEQNVRNETRIEMAFEEKRFYDLRRWRIMLDPAVDIQYGMYINRTAANAYTYTVTPVPANLNLLWQDKHYLFKIPISDTYLGPNFKQNPGW